MLLGDSSFPFLLILACLACLSVCLFIQILLKKQKKLLSSLRYYLHTDAGHPYEIRLD